ncbi:hypothetical protein ACHQM5_020777 [Ranunculus cassubicifolius]
MGGRRRVVGGFGLWWFLLFSFGLLFCSATFRNTLLSGSEMEVMVKQSGGRSLKVMVNDYGAPGANKGHDPRNKGVGRVGRKL